MSINGALIVACPQCGAKNRIPVERLGAAAKCGKCGTGIDTDIRYTLRCPECSAKNRIRADKLRAAAKCGKCAASLPTDALVAPQPMMVSDMNFDDKVIRSPLPVLVYAWAPSCPTCQSVGPVIDRFADASRGQVRVAKVNVSTSPQTASRLNVLGVPFLFIYDNGQLRDSMPGIADQHELMAKMAPYL